MAKAGGTGLAVPFADADAPLQVAPRAVARNARLKTSASAQRVRPSETAGFAARENARRTFVGVVVRPFCACRARAVETEAAARAPRLHAPALGRDLRPPYRGSVGLLPIRAKSDGKLRRKVRYVLAHVSRKGIGENCFRGSTL